MLEIEDGYGWQPVGAPLDMQKDDNWTPSENSVNAVSFGFVATAILISMFLIMAIFERFLRPNFLAGERRQMDSESQQDFAGKLGHPSSEMSMYSHEVSVLMPGDSIPTYIAHPVPVVPRPPGRLPCLHRQHSLTNLAVESYTNAVRENVV